MGRGPGLQRPAAAGHRPLADAEHGEPDDQPGADRAERVAEPGAAIVARVDVDDQVDEDEEQREDRGDLEPAIAAIAQEALMSRPVPQIASCSSPLLATLDQPPSPILVTLRNSSGETRIAAPVGQARTQAGPPPIPEHMSHLIAFFGVSELTLPSVHSWSGSPGPGPLPKNSQAKQARLLRRRLGHADHAIGAVALAIAAADAGVVDIDLAVRPAVDRVGRAIGHAMRMLAMAAARSARGDGRRFARPRG